MPKNTKKEKSSTDFQRDYEKVMKEYTSKIPSIEQQWSAPGDFFVKFSLYKETSTGKTSSSTSLINLIYNA